MTGKMWTTCESKIGKYSLVQKLWQNKIFHEKVAKYGRFPLYFGPKLKMGGLTVVKKILMYFIFCLLKSKSETV